MASQRNCQLTASEQAMQAGERKLTARTTARHSPSAHCPLRSTLRSRRDGCMAVNRKRAAVRRAASMNPHCRYRILYFASRGGPPRPVWMDAVHAFANGTDADSDLTCNARWGHGAGSMVHGTAYHVMSTQLLVDASCGYALSLTVWAWVR